ncbi:hypothetical protein IWX48DRAFT_378412 [Phyllosticta citricarpa]
MTTPRKPPTAPRADRLRRQAAVQDPGGLNASANSPAKRALEKQTLDSLPEASARPAPHEPSQQAPGFPDIGSFRPTRPASGPSSPARQISTGIQRTIAKQALARLAAPSQDPVSHSKDPPISEHGTGAPTSECAAGSPVETAAHEKANPSHPPVSQRSAPNGHEAQPKPHAAVSSAHRDGFARPKFPYTVGSPSSAGLPSTPCNARPGEMLDQHRGSRNAMQSAASRTRCLDPNMLPYRSSHSDRYPLIYSNDPDLSKWQMAPRNHAEHDAFVEREHSNQPMAEPEIKKEDAEELVYELLPAAQQTPPAQSARAQRAVAQEENASNSTELSKSQRCGLCANDHKTSDCPAEQCQRCQFFHFPSVNCFEAGSQRQERDRARAAAEAQKQASQRKSRQRKGAVQRKTQNQPSVCNRCGGYHKTLRCKVKKCPKCGLFHVKGITFSQAARQKAEREAVEETRNIQQLSQRDEGNAFASAEVTSKTQENDVGKSTASGDRVEKQCSQCGYIHEEPCRTPFCRHCCSYHTTKFNCFEAGAMRAQRDAFYATKESSVKARSEPQPEPQAKLLAEIQLPQPQILPEILPEHQRKVRHDQDLFSEALNFFYEKDGTEGAYAFFARFSGDQQVQLPIRPSPRASTPIVRSIEKPMVQLPPATHKTSKHQQPLGDDSTDWSTDYTSKSEEESRIPPKGVRKGERKYNDQDDYDGLSKFQHGQKKKTAHYDTEQKSKAKQSGPKIVQRSKKREHESESELEDEKPVAAARTKRRNAQKERQPVNLKSKVKAKAKQHIKGEPETSSDDTETSSDEELPPKPKRRKVNDSGLQKSKREAPQPEHKAKKEEKKKKKKKKSKEAANVTTTKASKEKGKTKTEQKHESKKSKKHK